ncbi:MAG: hypothetical protein JRG76_18020 [Deltaproteobacteria bacterium]|nr:hypothetical protein [Deltaproteobacteria bacterium]MBW2416398.1 hypothetical protein [Deltaproteobacteria bacterium]
MTRRLERGGFATFTADSTECLMRVVDDEAPDVLLLDARIEGEGDSLEPLRVLRKSKASGAELPVVLFLREKPSDGLYEEARGLGALPVWQSRISGRALRSLVAKALAMGPEGPSEGELLSLCERLRSTDPFMALGIQRETEPTEIARVYHRLRRWLDPGLLGRSGRELQAIVVSAQQDLERAYSAVCDPDSFDAFELEDPAPPVEQSPREAEAAEQHRTGEKLLERAENAAALLAFQRAAELAPEVGVYRACVGWAMYMAYGGDKKTIRQAIAHAKAGMKLAPEHYQPCLVLGRLYQCTSRLDLATKAFERSVQLNPESIDAVRELRIMRMRETKGAKRTSRLRRR